MGDFMFGVMFFAVAFSVIFFTVMGLSCRMFGKGATLKTLGAFVDGLWWALDDLGERLLGALEGFLYPPKSSLLDRLYKIEGETAQHNEELASLFTDLREIQRALEQAGHAHDEQEAQREVSARTTAPISPDEPSSQKRAYGGDY